MRDYRTRDFGRIKTEEDRWYYAAGIPQRFWVDTYDLTPVPLPCRGEDGTLRTLAPTVQVEHFNYLMNLENLDNPNLVVLGSTPTDEKALMAACRIAKVALKQWFGHVHVFDIAQYDKPRPTDRLVVMYNLSTSAYTPERILRVKDLIRAYQDRLCLVVVEGNPYEFALNIVKAIKPNALLYFEGNLRVVQRSL